jgi:diguanylate cyclase (GGDEF)-like protein
MNARGPVPVVGLVVVAAACGASAVVALRYALGERPALAIAAVLALAALLGCLTALLRRRPAPASVGRPAPARRDAAPAALADVDAPLRIALELLARALGADALVALAPARPAVEGAADGADGTLRVSAAWPPEDADLRPDPFPATAGLPGAALRDGVARAALVGDRAASLCPHAGPRRRVAHAIACPATLSGGRGVLVAERRRDPAFPAEAAGLLRSGAALLAWLGGAGEAMTAALDRVAALHRLSEAAHALASAAEGADVARHAVTAALALAPADVALLAVRDPDGGRLRVAAAAGPAAPREGASFPAAAGLAGRALALDTALPAPGRQGGAAAGPVLGEAPGWSPTPGGALAVVPLPGGGHNVGVLIAAAGGGAPPYDEARRLLLGSLARLAGAELHRRALERSLAELARTDPLTRLANRRAFDEALAAALRRSERYGHATSVLLLDLDHFKRVNDTYGHAVGDLVLQNVAEVLRSTARGVDVPARLGGEELALLLEHTPPEGARHVAERIRERVARLPFPCPEGTFHVTVSIGVACGPPVPTQPAALLTAADAALYEAKRAGRDRVVLARA